jgi:phage terminase small subunit
MSISAKTAVRIVNEANAIPTPKLPPPAHLTKEAAKVWRSIVADLPGDWFSNENAPLLEQLCNHIVFARHLVEQINRPSPTDRIDRLLRAHTQQTRCITSISTRLRLTQQSQYNAAQAKNLRKARVPDTKPWEDWGEPHRDNGNGADAEP